MRFKDLTNQRGITLIEVLLFGSISAMMLLWLASWLSKPARIQKNMLATWEEQKALRATDVFVNDIKQMIPGSLQVGTSAQVQILNFQIAGLQTPPGEPPGTPFDIFYHYESTPNAPTGSLYRTVNASSTLILEDILPPNAGQPLFEENMPLRMVTLDVRIRTTIGSILRVMRRVACPS